MTLATHSSTARFLGECGFDDHPIQACRLAWNIPGMKIHLWFAGDNSVSAYAAFSEFHHFPNRPEWCHHQNLPSKPGKPSDFFPQMPSFLNRALGNLSWNLPFRCKGQWFGSCWHPLLSDVSKLRWCLQTHMSVKPPHSFQGHKTCKCPPQGSGHSSPRTADLATVLCSTELHADVLRWMPRCWICCPGQWHGCGYPWGLRERCLHYQLQTGSPLEGVEPKPMRAYAKTPPQRHIQINRTRILGVLILRCPYGGDRIGFKSLPNRYSRQIEHWSYPQN